MTEFSGYTALAFSLIVIAGIAYAILVSSLRLLQDEGQLRLERMLKRHGASLDTAAVGMASYQTAVAVRRCAACADKKACDTWLASDKLDGAAAFCPNTSFVQRAARQT